MTDHGRRPHPVRLPGPRESDLHGEQHRLYPIDPLHGLPRLDDGAHGEAGLRGDQRVQLGDRCRERGFGAQQFAPHAGPLRALTGEHPHRAEGTARRGRPPADRGRVRLCPGQRAQPCHQLVRVARDHARAVVLGRATQRHRVRHVLQPDVVRSLLQPVGEASAQLRQRPGGGRRDRYGVRAVGSGLLRYHRGGRLEQYVRVGAGEAEGGDGGETGPVRDRPRGRTLRDEHPGALRPDPRIPAREPGVRDDDPLPQTQRGLDQPQHSGGGLRVSEVALDRPQRTPARSAAVDGGHGLELHHVADLRGGPVRLHQADACRIDSPRRGHLPHEFPLRRPGGRHQAVGTAVLVDAAGPDDGEDTITCRPCVGQPLEHDHPDTVATHHAIGGGVERTTAARRRERPAQAEALSTGLVEHDVRPTGERQVALTAAQTLTGEMDTHQGGGAGRVHGEGRATQSQRVGDPPCCGTRRNPRRGIRVRTDPAAFDDDAVVDGAEPDEDTTTAATDVTRPDTRMLQGLPRHLQQQPMLGVGHRRLLRRDPEERRGEAGHVTQPSAGPGPGICVRIGRTALGECPVGRRLGRQIPPVEEALPQFGHRLDSARQATGRADNGDRLARSGACRLPQPSAHGHPVVSADQLGATTVRALRRRERQDRRAPLQRGNAAARLTSQSVADPPDGGGRTPPNGGWQFRHPCRNPAAEHEMSRLQLQNLWNIAVPPQTAYRSPLP